MGLKVFLGVCDSNGCAEVELPLEAAEELSEALANAVAAVRGSRELSKVLIPLPDGQARVYLK